MQHAWLIHGPEGPERRQAARQLAAELAGGERAAELAANGHHPDVDEYPDPLRIETVREIAAVSGRPPVLGTKRVALLGGLGKASREAQNALLRLVEEPPDTLAFVAEALAPGELLATLRSRFLSRAVDRHGIQELEAGLAQAEVDIPVWARMAAAEAASGSLDRALLLSSVLAGIIANVPQDDGRSDWFVRAAEGVDELPKTWPAGLAAAMEYRWHRTSRGIFLDSWRSAAEAARLLETSASARLVGEVLFLRLQRLETMRDWPLWAEGGE